MGLHKQKRMLLLPSIFFTATVGRRLSGGVRGAQPGLTIQLRNEERNNEVQQLRRQLNNNRIQATTTQIGRFFLCSRCKRVPNGSPIYMCRTGHHECSVCFGKYSDPVLVEETDGSTDTESESVWGSRSGNISFGRYERGGSRGQPSTTANPVKGSTRKGENRIGVIFPKSSTNNPCKHTCAVCKDEVTKTRNLFAECLLNQLELMKIENRVEKSNYLPPMKINVQETKVQTNYVDCCYNIYGSPCQRFDTQNMSVPAYDPQMYSRYQIPCTVPQYNYTINPYVVTETQPQIEYADPNVYYPEYDNMTYYSCNNRKDMNDRRSKFNFTNQSSVVSLSGESSKRPIRCPTHLCGRNIAVAALSSHFCFDHPEVPPLNVDFDVSCHLSIDPEMIPFNHGRCVAILLIPNKCEAMSSVSHPSIISINKVKNSLPLVVMASKLDCSTSNQPNIGGIHEESQPESLNHGDFQTTGNGKSRLLVIWLAGVDTNSSMYTTIQVTEKHTNMRSMIYTGPIMSLRASQNTSKVFEQGDCLVIHSGVLENIVGDKGGFDLHVMVH